MADYCKAQAARASAVLTNAEVAATALALAHSGPNAIHDAQVSVRANFTIGSLTNVIIRLYASLDGTTYDLIYGNGGLGAIYTLTATDTIWISVPPLNGAKFFRATAQGTGDFTNSLLTLDYEWLRRGSQI